jgi:hypothetical protein
MAGGFKMKMIFAAAFLSLFSFAANADQCQWNSAADAQSAIALINMHKEVMHFCQNCGDAKPSFISEVDGASTAQANMSGTKYPYRTVVLTKGGKTQEVDLAYTYVRTASDVFANVAQLVGCPSQGAVTFIQTTNRNQKLLHYYDQTGARVDVGTTTAMIGTSFPEARKPASKK